MPKQKKEVPATSDKIQFFGEIDLNDSGNIGSDMPAWYLEHHVEELEESIIKKEGQVRRGDVTGDNLNLVREQIRADRARLKAILDSKPMLNDKQKDRCARVYDSLSKQIADSMPTRKQSKDGLVNPYNELRRMKQKHISIDPEIAKACGVKAVHGKISGDEANKCYQIIGKVLGENTNPEALRKDGGHPAYQMPHELTEKILEKFHN